MARIGDRGAYEPGNVRCIRPKQNNQDRPAEDKQAALTKRRATELARGVTHGQHLRVRGDGHPKSHAVMTPVGRFGSIALASETHGITRAGGLHRVRTGVWTLAT